MLNVPYKNLYNLPAFGTMAPSCTNIEVGHCNQKIQKHKNKA